MQGKLIVITGIDGSGKTVQTKLIYARLLREKYAVVTTDFPQYGKTFFAEMVIKYLKGEYGSADSVSPYLAALLYAGDRWEAKEQINNWLREGRIIISNRYVCDNMAHQGGKIHAPEEKDKFIQWLDKLEHHIFGIPRPDLNILLHVPVEIAYKLIEKKAPRTYLATSSYQLPLRLFGLIEEKAPRAYLAGEKKDVHE